MLRHVALLAALVGIAAAACPTCQTTTQRKAFDNADFVGHVHVNSVTSANGQNTYEATPVKTFKPHGGALLKSINVVQSTDITCGGAILFTNNDYLIAAKRTGAGFQVTLCSGLPAFDNAIPMGPMLWNAVSLNPTFLKNLENGFKETGSHAQSGQGSLQPPNGGSGPGVQTNGGIGASAGKQHQIDGQAGQGSQGSQDSQGSQGQSSQGGSSGGSGGSSGQMSGQSQGGMQSSQGGPQGQSSQMSGQSSQQQPQQQQPQQQQGSQGGMQSSQGGMQSQMGGQSQQSGGQDSMQQQGQPPITISTGSDGKSAIISSNGPLGASSSKTSFNQDGSMQSSFGSNGPAGNQAASSHVGPHGASTHFDSSRRA